MQVLHLNNDYYFTSIYQKLQEHLILRDIDSVTIVPSNINDIDRKELNVIQAKCFHKFDRYFFFRKQNKIIYELKKHIDSFRPDIIHAHFLFTAGYACMKIKEQYGIPYIVAVRNTDVNLFFKYMIHLRRVGLQIMSGAQKIVFLSPAYRDYVIKNYVPIILQDEIRAKTIIIPNGIDEFWLNNKHAKTRLDKDSPIRLITAGAINKNKNQITVAKAAQILNSMGYRTEYTTVGRVEDESEYRKLTKYSFVTYIDSCVKEELIKLYRKSDILVLPSKHETFGLVYAEAMSQGLPIIYSAGQGFDGQFGEGENGFRVDSLSADEIVRKIIEIISKYEELSNNCVMNCSQFDWRNIVSKYVEIYEATIATCR